MTQYPSDPLDEETASGVFPMASRPGYDPTSTEGTTTGGESVYDLPPCIDAIDRPYEF
jgi:hypothetical protein